MCLSTGLSWPQEAAGRAGPDTKLGLSSHAGLGRGGARDAASRGTQRLDERCTQLKHLRDLTEQTVIATLCLYADA